MPIERRGRTDRETVMEAKPMAKCDHTELTEGPLGWMSKARTWTCKGCGRRKTMKDVDLDSYCERYKQLREDIVRALLE